MENDRTLTCQFCNVIVRGEERQVERTWMPRRASTETHGRPPLYPYSLRFWSCPPSFKFHRVSATGTSLPMSFGVPIALQVLHGENWVTFPHIRSLETLTVNQWKIHSKMRRYENYPWFLPSSILPNWWLSLTQNWECRFQIHMGRRNGNIN